MSQTETGINHVVLIRNWYFELTRAVPMSGATFVHVPNVFFGHLNIPYGLPKSRLTDNEAYFLSKCSYLSVFSSIKFLTGTVYYPEGNGRAKHFEK